MPLKIRYIGLAGLIMALASVPLFLSVPNPYNNMLLQHLHNCGHSLLFFVLHLLSFYLVRHALRRYSQGPHLLLAMIATSIASFMIGLAIEGLQPLVGRNASWGDVGRNSLGIIAANGAILTIFPEVRRHSVKIIGAFIAVTALLLSLMPALPWAYAQLLQAQAFPLLADFQNRYINKYIFSFGARISIIQAPAEWQNNHSLVARIVMPQGVKYPGMQLRNPTLSWQHYSTLVFEVYSPSAVTETVAINLYSTEKGRRPLLHRKFAIKPGVHTYRMKLPDQTLLKTHHITDAIWHTLHPDRTVVLYLDNVRLEH